MNPISRLRLCLPLWLFCGGLVVGMAGCSDDSPTAPSPPASSVAFVASGQLAPGDSYFVIRTEDPTRGRRFVIRGENLRRDGGALAVDVTVANHGRETLRLPATFTLVSILPDTVGVFDADNGETGAGASFDLHFTERDTGWQPGEVSQPLTLRFDVEEGVSLGFAVRIDVQMSNLHGSIGGMVFEDLDADGSLDPEETGIGGVRIQLVGADGPVGAVGTAEDGSYRFEGLPAGVYTVRKAPQQGLAPTTPVEIQVLLTADDEGNVSDFLMASFGCLFAPVDGRRELAVGDQVEVTGRYHDDPSRLVAYEVEWEHDDRWAELRGPVTAVVDDEGVMEVMGVAVHVEDAEIHGGGPSDRCQDRRAGDLELEERVRVRLIGPRSDAQDALPRVERLKCWSGHPEKAHGSVESIERGKDDEIVSFVVTGLTVEITDRTDFDDDDDDDDEEDD